MIASKTKNKTENEDILTAELHSLAHVRDQLFILQQEIHDEVANVLDSHGAIENCLEKESRDVALTIHWNIKRKLENNIIQLWNISKRIAEIDSKIGCLNRKIQNVN